MGGIIRHHRPELNRPYLVAGFEGWPDAGRVSSGVVGYLRDKLNARKCAEVKPDDFYIFQAPGVEGLRPTASIEEGLVRQLDMPSACFWAWHDDRVEHDVVLLLGVEPHLRWNEFAGSVLDFAEELGVERLFTVGGVHNWVPHTIEPVVSIVANDPELARELGRHGTDSTTYEGPSSVHTLLLLSAGNRGLKAASLWGHAPFYIQVPNTKVCYGVLKVLSETMRIDFDLDEIREAAEELDEQVNSAMEQKPELKEYVRRLEEQYSIGGRYDEPLGQDVIREVEDLLRGSKDGEE